MFVLLPAIYGRRKAFFLVLSPTTVYHSTMLSFSPIASLSDVGLIVAAAGSAARFGDVGNKLLLPLGSTGLPVFCHCLRNLAPLLSPASTVLVVATEDSAIFQDHLEACGLSSLVRVVVGGARRQDSVLAGLHALPASVNYVAVQDAARPLVTGQLLQRCVDAARQHGAAIAAARAVDTIKLANKHNFIESTPERRLSWAAQTPQVFQKELLLRSLLHCQKENLLVTDDAQALEHCGHQVVLVENQSPNPKITYPTDMMLVNHLLALANNDEKNQKPPN